MVARKIQEFNILQKLDRFDVSLLSYQKNN